MLLVSFGRERALVDSPVRDVRVKTSGASPPIGSLSGGNQQKVVIGKMLTTGPKVFLLDEPSRGIDVGAKSEVFRLLAERATKVWRCSIRHRKSANASASPIASGDAPRPDIAAEFGSRDQGGNHGGFGRSRGQRIIKKAEA